MTPSITPQELQAALEQGDVTLLDVRREPAFEEATDMVLGATWQDPEAVDAWTATLPPAGSVVVYCVHGHQVSQGAADRLREFGFDARYLEGGIEGWREAGGTLVARPALAG